MFNIPEVQKRVITHKIEATSNKSSASIISNACRYAEAHLINAEMANVEDLVS